MLLPNRSLKPLEDFLKEKCDLIFKLERLLLGRICCTEVSESSVTGYTIAAWDLRSM